MLKRIAEMGKGFTDFISVVAVYEAPKHKAMPLDLVETLCRGLGLQICEAISVYPNRRRRMSRKSEIQ